MHTIKIIEFIKGLMADNFWGSIEIKFEDGKPKICRKTESIKFN